MTIELVETTREELEAKRIHDPDWFQGKMFRCEDYAYRMFPAANNSALSGYDDCPAKAYILRKGGRPDTAALKFGRAAHTAILESHLFSEQWASTEGKPTKPERPEKFKGMRKSKKPDCPITAWENEAMFKYEKELKEYNDRVSGRELLKPDEMSAIEAMGAKSVEDPYISQFVDGGWAEVALFHLHPIYGWVKCKIDKYLPDRNIVVDLKTTKDSMHDFRKSIFKYDYEVQGAFYSDIVEWVTGNRPRAYVILGMQKFPPYEPIPVILDETSMRLGEHIYKRRLKVHTVCLKNDRWPGYERKIKSVTPPKWKLDREGLEIEIGN